MLLYVGKTGILIIPYILGSCIRRDIEVLGKVQGVTWKYLG